MIWVERRLISGSLIEVEQLIDVVDAVLRSGASLVDAVRHRRTSTPVLVRSTQQ